MNRKAILRCWDEIYFNGFDTLSASDQTYLMNEIIENAAAGLRPCGKVQFLKNEQMKQTLGLIHVCLHKELEDAVAAAAKLEHYQEDDNTHENLMKADFLDENGAPLEFKTFKSLKQMIYMLCDIDRHYLLPQRTYTYGWYKQKLTFHDAKRILAFCLEEQCFCFIVNDAPLKIDWNVSIHITPEIATAALHIQQFDKYLNYLKRYKHDKVRNGDIREFDC